MADVNSTDVLVDDPDWSVNGVSLAPAPEPPPSPTLPTSRWTVYRRSADLTRVGLLEFETCEVALKWTVGSRFIITCHQDEAGDIGVGDGLILARNGQTVISGIVSHKVRERDGDAETVTLAGMDDTARLAGRIVYPSPDVVADGDQGDRDLRSGPAETVIGQYVNVNAGPGALEPRRIPGLTVAASGGRGEEVDGFGRWDPLLEFIANLADRGDIGYRAVQKLGVAPTIVFEAVVPAERHEARFDLDGLSGSGALEGWGYELTLPAATVAIAGGRGELADRHIEQGVNASEVSAWGWWETWLDRRNAGRDPETAEDPVEAMEEMVAELEADIDDALREGRSQVELDFDAVDTPGCAWGYQYELGDRVRVKFAGTWMWRQVREIDITVGPDGETVSPKLGGLSRRKARRLLARLGELERRMQRMGRS